MDDLAETLRPLPLQVANLSEAVDRLTVQVERLAVEMAELRSDLAATQRQIAQIGWGLAAGLLTVLVALVISVA